MSGPDPARSYPPSVAAGGGAGAGAGDREAEDRPDRLPVAGAGTVAGHRLRAHFDADQHHADRQDRAAEDLQRRAPLRDPGVDLIQWARQVRRARRRPDGQRSGLAGDDGHDRFPLPVFFSGYPAAGDAATVVVAKVVAGAAPPTGSGAAPMMSVTCHRPAAIRNEIE